MGMPISCYSTLLGILGHDNWLRDRAEDALKPFSKFAFVIHDPVAHREFDLALNQSFDDLDQWTGERLLFFALVRPESAEHIEDLKQRRYYRLFEEKAQKSWQDWSAAQQLASPEAIPAATDPSLLAMTLAHAFQLSFESLPCIVTTDDLLNDQIEVQPTQATTLVSQLTELGKGETRGSRCRRDAKQQQGELFESGYHLIRLTNSMASTLSAVLGAMYVSQCGGDSNIFLAEYRRGFVASLRELLHELRHARAMLSTQDEPPEKFQQLALTIAGVLQTLAAEPAAASSHLIESFNSDFFEHETRIMLQTAMRCLQVLKEAPWLDWNEGRPVIRLPHDDTHLAHEIDFTPSLISLAKAFENEMNLSVGHWVRQRLGVSLPEYFKRVQRGVDAKYTPKSIPDGRPIDFNLSRRGEWLPPGLGQTELACAELASGYPPTPFDHDTWQALMQAWQKIRASRNQAAHPGLVRQDQCEVVLSQMKTLLKSGIFRSSSELKRVLRGKEA